MRSNIKYGRAAIISAFFVGGGQIYSGRVWSGFALAGLFYGSIALMVIIWTGLNQAFWGLIAAWLIFWLYNIFDAYKGINFQKPPCEKACPAGIAPWLYVNLIATESEEKYPYIPFFGTLEHICPAPCEEQCTRRGIDAAVAIKYLKRCVQMEENTQAVKENNKSIAIIGGGPCGLSATHYLAKKGYNITIYDREKKLGGVLTTLIPKFRLPDDMLESEIKATLSSRVNLKLGTDVGKDITIESLLEEYDAIFVAIGAWRATKLSIPGEENALSGFDILRKIKEGTSFNLGKVGIIGGGNTAIDVARSLLRQGNDVKIFYRRRIMDMPAEHEDRIEAQEEGIEIIQLTTPVLIEKNRVVMTKTECKEGRRSSVEIVKGSEFDANVDVLVITAGQYPESDFLKSYVKTDKRGRILTKHGRTSHPKIFAGGDAVLGSATVAHAVGQGLNAAEMIDIRLRKVPLFIHTIFKKHFVPSVKLLPLQMTPRIEIPHRNVKDRVRDFGEVELKAPKEDLEKESCRCLTCPLKYSP